MIRTSAGSLLKEFLNPKVLKTESLDYGIQNEQKARDFYKIDRDVHVFQIEIIFRSTSLAHVVFMIRKLYENITIFTFNQQC